MTERDTNKPHYAWLILAGCCVMIFFSYGLCNNVAGQFITAITEELGLGKGPLSMYLTIQGFAQLMMLPILGRSLPKMNVRAWMSGAAITMALCFFFMSFLSTVYGWWAIGVVIGVSMSFLGMLPVPILLGNWFQQRHAFAIGLAMCFSGVGGMVLNPLTNFLIQANGWRVTYRIMALLCLAALLPVTGLIVRFHPRDVGLLPYGAEALADRQGGNPVAEGISYEQAKRMPQFYLLILMTATTAFASSLNQHFSGMALSAGLDVSVGTLGVTVLMATYIVNRLGMGALCELWNYRMVSVLCFAVGGSGMLILLLVRSPSTGLFLSATILYAIGSSLASFIEPIVTKGTFGQRDYSRIYSYSSMTLSFVASAGISIHGFAYDLTGGYSLSYGMIAACFIISILCVCTMTRRTAKPARTAVSKK